MENILTEFMVAFGRAIKVERARRDLSQEELAYMAGLSPQFLCRLENARKTAHIETYLRIAAVLHLQWTDLFGDDK